MVPCRQLPLLSIISGVTTCTAMPLIIPSSMPVKVGVRTWVENARAVVMMMLVMRRIGPKSVVMSSYSAYFMFYIYRPLLAIMMMMMMMMMSILTAHSLLPAAFYSYTPHLSFSFSFLPYLTIPLL